MRKELSLSDAAMQRGAVQKKAGLAHIAIPPFFSFCFMPQATALRLSLQSLFDLPEQSLIEQYGHMRAVRLV